MNKRISLCIMTGLSLTLASTQALAAPYSKLVAFGDSLTDTGQYPDAESPTVTIGGNTIPTANFRLTNRTGPTYQSPEPHGPIAIEFVAAGLGLDRPNPSSPILPGTVTGVFPGSNYAIAGEASDKILATIKDVGGATVSVGTSETVRDGYLVENPTADPNALYYMNGGANDIINGIPTGLVGVDIEQAADNIANGFNALHAAGANYIVVANVPDLANTPLGSTLSLSSPALVQGMSQATLGYNQLLLQRINQSEANILAVDLDGLLSYAIENSEQFGFSSGTTCFDDESRDSTVCIEDPEFGIDSATPNPDNLVFYDDVHPTTRAQGIVADYTLSALTAPSEISLLPALALEFIHSDLQQQQSTAMATQSLNPFGDYSGHYALTRSSHSLENPVYGNGFEGESLRFSLIGQRRMNDHWRIGGRATASQGEFTSTVNRSRVNVDGASLALFMLFNDQRYHSSGSLTYTHIRYGDIFRHAPLGNLENRFDTADTKGAALSARVSTLYDLSFDEGQWQYGPSIDISATDITVDEYSEASSSITALNVSEQSWTSLQVTYGAFAQYINEESTVSFITKLGLLEEYGIDSEEVGVAYISLDANPAYLPGYQKSSQSTTVLQANLTYSPWAASRISVIYQGSYGQHDQDSLALGLTFHF